MHKNDHKNITYVKTIQTQRINSLQSLNLKQGVRYNDLIVYFSVAAEKNKFIKLMTSKLNSCQSESTLFTSITLFRCQQRSGYCKQRQPLNVSNRYTRGRGGLYTSFELAYDLYVLTNLTSKLTWRRASLWAGNRNLGGPGCSGQTYRNHF